MAEDQENTQDEAPEQTGIPLEGAEETTIQIQGVKVNVPKPFGEGHTLRANEAHVLNQVYSENIRNNLSTQVKKAVEAGQGESAVQKIVADYVQTYDFGVRRSGGGGGRTTDPVEKEAIRLAKDKVKAALRQKGYKINDVGNEKVTEMAHQALEQHPEIRESARKIVDLKQGVGEELSLGDES